MTRTRLSIKSLCLIPLAAVGISGAALAQMAPSKMPSASMPQAGMAMGADSSHDMKASMMNGMEAMRQVKASGDVDKDFATMMKMHHQQALTMAEMEIKHGKSPAMKAIAKDIIAAQKKEIAKFDQWLSTQK